MSVTDIDPNKGALWTWTTDPGAPHVIVARIILGGGRETHIRITERDLDRMKESLAIGRLSHGS